MELPDDPLAATQAVQGQGVFMGLENRFKRVWIPVSILTAIVLTAVFLLQRGNVAPFQDTVSGPTVIEPHGTGANNETGPAGEPTPPFPCTLKIPSLGLELPVQQGSRDRRRLHVQLREGPVHLPWTSLPGGEGNCVISGHRTTYTRPFHRLDELKEGDEITLVSGGKSYVYRVYRVFQVGHWVDVTGYTVAPTLTLTTCAPKGSSSQRLVVRASFEGTGGEGSR